MADITPPVPTGRQVIRRYGEGGFEIAGVRHQGSVLVMAERTVSWTVSEPGEIDDASLAPILEAGVTVLLIGTGTTMVQVDPALRADLRRAGIGVETMDTGAACRTFNVLLAEDRAVAAALIAV